MTFRILVLCGFASVLSSCGLSSLEQMAIDHYKEKYDTPELQHAMMIDDALKLQRHIKDDRTKTGGAKLDEVTGSAKFTGYALINVDAGASGIDKQLLGDAVINVNFDGVRTLTGTVSDFVQVDFAEGVDTLDGNVTLISTDIEGTNPFFTIDYDLDLSNATDTFQSVGTVESMFKGNPFYGVDDPKFIDNVAESTIVNSGEHNGETVTFNVGIFASSNW